MYSKLSNNFFIWFICLFLYHNALGYESILTEISSYKSCQQYFSNFTLSQVSQFGATCDIIPPKRNQSEVLLKYNTIPILCMGLYEVSQQLCTGASEDKTRFSDIIPPSEEKFKHIFEMLDKDDGYSSLRNFCNVTIKNGTGTNVVYDSSDSANKFWWNLIIKKLTNVKRCMTFCSTNENDKVHPLCSYIIWSNGMYINHLKSLAPSQSRQEDAFSNTNLTSGKENSYSYNPTDNNKFEVMPDDNEVATLQPEVSNAAVSSAQPEVNSTALTGVKASRTGTHEKISSRNNTSLISNKVSSSDKNFTLIKQHTGESKSALPQKLADKKKAEDATEARKNTYVENTSDALGLEENLNKDSVLPTPDEKNEVEESLHLNKEESEQTPITYIDADNSEPNVEVEDGNQENFLNEDDQNETPEKTSEDKYNPHTNLEMSKSGLQSEEVQKILTDPFQETEDSNFFPFFLCAAVLTIMAYLVFHNKKKLVALAIEGRKTRGSRRRPNCSKYSKLDCSLEEAMVSNTKASVTHVLY